MFKLWCEWGISRVTNLIMASVRPFNLIIRVYRTQKIVYKCAKETKLVTNIRPYYI